MTTKKNHAHLAVLILTKNEEANIADYIKSATCADDVIVIDSGSTDKTQEIAESLDARFVHNDMSEGFAAQRNFALTLTDDEWVLYLDADERLTREANDEIRAIVDSDTPASERKAYEIKRLNIIFGQMMMHGGHKPDWSLRLYPSGTVTWHGEIHESANVTCPVARMKSPMHHYTYRDWTSYVAKLNRYTTMAAEEMAEKGKRPSIFAIIAHPLWGFFRDYILRLGFLDGALGLFMAGQRAVYLFEKYLKARYI